MPNADEEPVPIPNEDRIMLADFQFDVLRLLSKIQPIRGAQLPNYTSGTYILPSRVLEETQKDAEKKLNDWAATASDQTSQVSKNVRACAGVMGACYVSVLWKVGMISLRGLSLLEDWKGTPPYLGFVSDFILGTKRLQTIINDDDQFSSSTPSAKLTEELSGFTSQGIEEFVSFMSSDPEANSANPSIQPSRPTFDEMQGLFEDLSHGILF